MTSLPSWVLLSLRENLTAAELVTRAASYGVRADLTRDGLQLPGGFLARVEGPFAPRLADRSLAGGDLSFGPATLHVSGGTNELARSSHQEPAELRAMAKETAARLAAATGANDTRIESQASRKMTSLTQLVRALAPLATAVVLPKANHLAFDARDFAERIAEHDDGRSYSFPLWSYLKVRDDEDCETLVSTGMWVFGLPDVAMALPRGADRDRAVLALGSLQREMVAEGFWPEDGSTFSHEGRALSLSRAWDGVWVEPEGVTPNDAARRARSRFARSQQLGLLLGDRTQHHSPFGEDRLAIEHFLRSEGNSIAVTNGLSDAPQPGGTSEDENERVELTLTSPALGPWADGWLGWASQYLRGGDGSHPIRPLDRLVLPQPAQGIAGAIVWPMGHLPAADGVGPTTQLWDLIPFFVEELASFRASPTAQRVWMDERLARGDFAEIQRRWTPEPG